MEAHVLWKELNSKRYECKVCRFRSHNKKHYERHLESNKHFLLTTFAEEAPRDIKVLVASFLPLYKLIRLPSVGKSALKLAWKRHPRYRHYPRAVLPYLVFGPRAFLSAASLHAQNADEESPVPRNVQNRVYAIVV